MRAPTTSPAFRRYVAAQTRTRLYAFVHIANIGLTGFPVAELYNIDFAQPDAAARAIAENADMVLGAKVRMSENVIAKHGLEPLKRAISACEKAGSGAKVMCHIGGVETRALMSQILDLLRPGDILTHCYSGFPNLAGDFTNIVQDGRSCRLRLPPSSAAWSSTSGTAAAASTTRLRKRQSAGLPARHDLLRHPCVLRQHAGYAVPHLGDEQIHGTWLLP